MNIISFEGSYQDADDRVPFKIEISTPLWSERLLVYQSVLESEELFASPISSAGMTPKEAIEASFEMVKIILSYRTSDLYQADKLDVS